MTLRDQHTILQNMARRAAELLRDELQIEVETAAIFKPGTRPVVPVAIDHDAALFVQKLATAIRDVGAITGPQPGRTWPDWLNEMVTGTSPLLKPEDEVPL